MKVEFKDGHEWHAGLVMETAFSQQLNTFIFLVLCPRGKIYTVRATDARALDD